MKLLFLDDSTASTDTVRGNTGILARQGAQDACDVLYHLP